MRRGCFLVVRRGGALPRQRATARGAPTENRGNYCNRADVGIGPYGMMTGNVTRRAVDASAIPAAPEAKAQVPCEGNGLPRPVWELASQ